MFKLRYLPQYFLALLLLLLLFFEGWTYYLGIPSVTFERLVGAPPYEEIEDLSLRRYKEGAISPHLFSMKTEDEQYLVAKFVKGCRMQKVTAEELPDLLKEVDAEMVEVIEKSPFIYMRTTYDLHNSKVGRLCVLFRDSEKIYLFVNGNL